MQQPNDESGFSMVEVIVAITIAGILLAVIAPLVIGTVVATGKMTTIASATQIASAGEDSVRSQLAAANGPATCSSLVSASPAVTTSTDQRGVTMRRAVTVTGACTSKSLATVVVRVATVGNTGLFRDGTQLASTRTRVYLP